MRGEGEDKTAFQSTCNAGTCWVQSGFDVELWGNLEGGTNGVSPP